MKETQNVVPLLAEPWRKRENDELVKQLISMMKEEHPLFNDMSWITCNSGFVHKGKFFGGVARITEPTASARASDYIDYREFERDGKCTDCLRQSVSVCIVAEILADRISRKLLYGDRNVIPESINGLCKRLGKCNGKDKQKASYNVISAMEVSKTTAANAPKDLTSIYLVGNGRSGFHGLVPDDGSAVVHSNIIGLDGKHIANDDEGNPYPAIEIQLSMDYGCCLHDFHFAARLANISLTALEQGTTTFTSLWEALTQIYRRIRICRHAASWSFYATPKLLVLLDLEAEKGSAAGPNRPTLNNEGVLFFNGIPIKSEDAIQVGEDFVPEDK